MNGFGARTVYRCEEFGPVAVPISEVLRDGELEVYPEVSGKGYFDIDYQEGNLHLKATRYVGLIPITDRVAIHVAPRWPIANLLYLLWRGGGSPRILEGFARSYARSEEKIGSPDLLYADAFLAALRRIRESGLLKRYQRRETNSAMRGRFLPSRSINESIAKGIRHRPFFEVFEFGHDCPENRVVKGAAERLANLFMRSGGDANRKVAIEFRRMLMDFTNVSAGERSEIIARLAPSLIRAIPTRHHDYEPAIWLALLLATQGVVLLEATGGARFETLVVDVSRVFENYVRRLCVDAEAGELRGIKTIDGNERPAQLFVSGINALTHPDIYFEVDGKPIAVVDVKYKPQPTPADRYELLAFCEALGVKRAAFVYPQTGERPLSELYGETRGGIRILGLTLRLDGDRMKAEKEFLDCISTFVRDAMN